MKLRWNEEYPGSWWAYSGQLVVGMTGRRNNGSFYWKIDAVHMKHIAKGYGDVKSIRSGKLAIERAWSKWLDHAGLRWPIAKPLSEIDEWNYLQMGPG